MEEGDECRGGAEAVVAALELECMRRGGVWEKPESKLRLCLPYLRKTIHPSWVKGNLDLNDEMQIESLKNKNPFSKDNQQEEREDQSSMTSASVQKIG